VRAVAGSYGVAIAVAVFLSHTTEAPGLARTDLACILLIEKVIEGQWRRAAMDRLDRYRTR
jgi:hypothetical protein